MRRHDEMRLRTAVQALQGDAPDAAQLDASAKRVASRLGIDVIDHPAVDIIENCGDVQQLFASYRAGTLSGAAFANARSSVPALSVEPAITSTGIFQRCAISRCRSFTFCVTRVAWKVTSLMCKS